MLAVLNNLVGASSKWQVSKEHFSPSKLGLAHKRHLVLIASSNSHVDDGFSDHLDAMKICS